jgi:hypothetical protein
MDDNSIRCWCEPYQEHGQAGLAVVGHGDGGSDPTPHQESELVEMGTSQSASAAQRAERIQGCIHFSCFRESEMP